MIFHSMICWQNEYPCTLLFFIVFREVSKRHQPWFLLPLWWFLKVFTNTLEPDLDLQISEKRSQQWGKGWHERPKICIKTTIGRKSRRSCLSYDFFAALTMNSGCPRPTPPSYPPPPPSQRCTILLQEGGTRREDNNTQPHTPFWPLAGSADISI